MKFIVSYRQCGAKLFTGFDVFSAPSLESAVDAARAKWIENWNLSFPHNPDGKTAVKGVEFVGEESVAESKLVRMNRLAMRMDEACEGVHPSAWNEVTATDREEWKRLAKTV